MKINLLRPATGVALIARGQVVKPGRRLIVVTAEICALNKNGAERSLAVMQGTLVPVLGQ